MAPDPAPTLPPPTSPWVVLGSIPRVVELDGGADVSLALAAPPRVSRLSVSPRVFPASPTPRNFPFVLAADPSSGLLLLSAILDAPLTRVDVDLPDGKKAFCWRDDDPRYFVLDAATGAARRLADPDPKEPVEHQALLSVLASPGGAGRDVVAELLPFMDTKKADLGCFDSDVGEWVNKRAHTPLRTLSDPRYFVLDAVTGSALRLPDPAPQETVEHQALLGLLACPGGGGRYVVAELLPLIGGDTATLRCYYSDVGEWVAKSVRYPLPPRTLAPIRTLALHGRLWWADYSWGVLTADPFADDPVLGFVPLPRPCVLPSGEALGVLDKFRYVGVSAGNLRFVDTYRRGGGAPNKVTVWTLPDRDATEWVLEHEATFADIWADDTYKATGLPKKPPVLALIHPLNPAVVYFFLEDHLFAVDVPARKVVECDRYHLVAPPRDYGIANRFVRHWELPRAVSSGNHCCGKGPKSKRHDTSKHVTIHFCDQKFHTLSTNDSTMTVIDVVYSILLKNEIITRDFYLRLKGRIIDGSVLINTLEDPIIEVCPRLRRGVHPFYECTYERFDVIIAQNVANLHRVVVIPNVLMGPNPSHNAVFLAHLPQTMLHGLLAHILSDGHITRRVSWRGKFTSNDALISGDGHVMIDPNIELEDYTDVRGELDYEAIHEIAYFHFAYDQDWKKISPVHFKHLLKMLSTSTPALRRNRLFVLFLVCHPSLLTYCEKYKLYGLVELLLHRLTPNENADLDNWLQQNSGGYDQWESRVGPQTLFYNTYMYKAKKIKGNRVPLYKAGLREGFRFGRNFEAHPPQPQAQAQAQPQVVLNSLASDAFDYTFFFLLTVVIEGLVKTLQPGQSADDLADILSDVKADPATVRKHWALAQQ